MTRMPLALAAAMLLAVAPALAQSLLEGSTGNEPLSNVPTNGTAANTRTTWSPRLPTPVVDEGAPPLAFLKAAQRAIVINQTGEAQEALERAESRALDRAVRPSSAGQPSRQPLVHQIAEARRALAGGDKGMSLRLIEGAMKNPDASEKD